eukprot:9191726-Pyramimonas_sp.AAC.2
MRTDLLDAIGEGSAAGDGLLEGVEVAHDQVDGANLVLLQRLHVLGVAALGQDAAMHHGVEGLDAATQHLREAGDLIHLGDGDSGCGHRVGTAAGGDYLIAQLGQALGELREAGLVENGHKRLSLGRGSGGLHTHPPRSGELHSG